MPLSTEVGIGPDHIVLVGDPALPPMERGTAPPLFSAHVYCGQTVPMSATAELLLGYTRSRSEFSYEES